MSFRTEDFAGVRHIVVDNLGAGSLTVDPVPEGDLVEVALNAADDGYLEQVQVRLEHDQLRVTFPPAFSRNPAAQVRITAPAGLTYALRSASADVSVTVDAGRTKIVSGAGDITVGAAFDLDCSTGSGAIYAGRVEGVAARLVSGSGDVTVAEAYCPVSAKSGSGDVTVRSLHGVALQANSGSGAISVPRTTGSVDLRSASGSLTIGVADDLLAWLDLHSVTGAVRIALESVHQPTDGERFVSLRGRTASGDIAVYRA